MSSLSPYYRQLWQQELAWSKSEKAIGSRAFDGALQRELQEVIQEAKQMSNKVGKPSELWELEHHLTQRRKEIDHKHEFRQSQLALLFGRLLYENRINEKELRGLGEDKLNSIRGYARFMAETAGA